MERLHVIAIYTSPAKGMPMQSHEYIQAVKEVGLVGDRYAQRSGAWNGVRIPDEDRQVSLISAQAILEANLQLASLSQPIKPFAPEQTRRNLVVDISPEKLNALVGSRFVVDGVEIDGSDLCTICTRPAILVGRSQEAQLFESAFKDRGGIRGRIMTSGVIYAIPALVRP
jgi:hypothetical protein